MKRTVIVLLVITFVAGVIFGALATSHMASANTPKYRVVQVKEEQVFGNFVRATEEILNANAAEGYEFVTIYGGSALILKKP